MQAVARLNGGGTGSSDTIFPADVDLRLVIAQSLFASTTITLTMSWWRCAQLAV
ncbi:MAG: hypothetical protein AB1508_19010 [Pseudomonadota bacterium]